MTAATAKPAGREAAIVAVIWLVLMGMAGLSLFWLHRNALRIINNIEVVRGGRVRQAEALHIEGMRSLGELLKESARANTGSAEEQHLPPDNPHFAKTIDYLNRSLALNPRPEISPGHTVTFEALAQAYAIVGDNQAFDLASAKALLCAGNYESATDYAKKALEADPKNTGLFLLVAEGHLGMGRLEDAMANIVKADFDPSTTRSLVHEIRARVALAQKELTTASLEYRLAVQADPDDTELRKQLALLFDRMKEVDNGIEVLEEGMARGGEGDPNYLHLYGILLNKAGRESEAIPLLQRAEELAPNSGDVKWELARALHRSGDIARANSLLQQAILLKPELQSRAFE